MELSSVPHSVTAGFYLCDNLRSYRQVSGLYLPGARLTTLRRHINSALQSLQLKPTSKDVVHQTYYFPTKLSKGKLIVTVHDMIDELNLSNRKNVHPFSELKNRSCQRADRIIAISESTKSDLVHFFGISPDKISVVYHGNSLDKFSLASIPLTNQERPYLLFVGNRDDYKNFRRLLCAYSTSKSLSKEFDLICFGGKPFTREELSVIQSHSLQTRVRRETGDDFALAKAYRNATALIYPSLYEGFGLPLIEAMSMECPVVTSKGSSLTEIAGTAAAFFDPYNIEDMQSIIEQTVFDESRRQSLVSHGSKRHQSFTWEECYKNTMEIYTEISS
jgi:glycosyltransferase involved in cell wall biosynthesis